MAGVTSAAHPGVLWAQRARLAFVTVEVSDCENPEIKVKKYVPIILKLLIFIQHNVIPNQPNARDLFFQPCELNKDPQRALLHCVYSTLFSCHFDKWPKPLIFSL
jgi:hypothetical protein